MPGTDFSDTSGEDLLVGAQWHCAEASSGSIERPDAALDALNWIAAEVPGTVAAALAAAGIEIDPVSIDERDWWFRARFESPDAVKAELDLEGLAGFAEVWLNGVDVAASDDMFLPVRASTSVVAGENELLIRFRSLAVELAGRRPRPRWREPRLRYPNLRWARQTLMGRLVGAPPVPPTVGPWRPVLLLVDAIPRVVSRFVQATPVGAGGTVEVRVGVRGALTANSVATLEVDGVSTPAVLEEAEGGWLVRAEAKLDSVERWWPRGWGPQPLYPVALRIDGRVLDLGRVGFRDLRIDETDGGFRFVMNDTRLFLGGAVWMPADPIGLSADRSRLLPLLETVARGNLTMLRVPGDSVYESDTFYDICDELGILVWQDCRLAFIDPPSDEEWEALFLRELRANLGRLGGRPSLAMLSGGTEMAQQAAYMGVPVPVSIPLLTELIPAVVAEELGGAPYVPSSPWGGDIVSRPDTGVAHYYGVGAYLRELHDARAASPRFAAECLAFAVPPQRETVERYFGGPVSAGQHDPVWTRTVYRDAGASWDFEDVRDHYLARLFELEPLQTRRTDPGRYLELGRATISKLVGGTLGEWRRRASPSGGGLVFYLCDSVPGAGLGIVDSDLVPKAPWYALRRTLAPLAVTISDEGLNGLMGHLHNSAPEPFSGLVRVELFVNGELRVDVAEREVVVAPRSSTEFGIDAMFGGFRDLAWAHHFGNLSYDVIAVSLVDEDGRVRSEHVHLAGGLARQVERDLGLGAEVVSVDGDTARVIVRTRMFAQFVSVDVPGWLPEDCGFDLPPGRAREIELVRRLPEAKLVGTVSALNGGSVSFRAASA